MKSIHAASTTFFVACALVCIGAAVLCGGLMVAVIVSFGTEWASLVLLALPAVATVWLTYAAIRLLTAMRRAVDVDITCDGSRMVVRGGPHSLAFSDDDVRAYHPYNGKVVLVLGRDHGSWQFYPFVELRADRLTIRINLLEDRARMNRLLQDFDPHFAAKTKVTTGMLLDAAAS